MSETDLRPLVKQYGRNCNAFLSLYPGFRSFTSADPSLPGAIVFADTTSAWIGASEPLAPTEAQTRLLAEFAARARQAGKAAALLPVDGATAARAQAAGYDRLMIGVEPTFDFVSYDPAVETVLGARQMLSRGARVHEFSPASIQPEQRAELDMIVREWLASRKTAELGFLNRIAPWLLSEDKKYFLVEHKNRTLAFLAAVPMWKRGGWYLIDVLKRDDSPSGATELLLLEAMRLLKKEGAREVSLGVAPLAGLESAPIGEHPWLYPLLRAVYARGTPAYQFRSLHQFKQKFTPTLNDPAYLIYAPARLGIRVLRGLGEAFVPSGILPAAITALGRLLARLDLSALIKKQIDSSVVVRSVPPSLGRLLYRCRLTSAVFTAMAVGFFMAPSPASRTFTFRAFLDGGLFSGLKQVLSSSFLHWDLWHLGGNALMLVTFTGLLEYLAGTTMTALCLFLPLLTANGFTFLFLILPLKMFAPGAFLAALDERDLGTSLGILGCAGGLAHFLKYRRIFAVIVSAVIVAGALFHGSPIFLNHLTAFWLGFALAWARLKN